MSDLNDLFKQLAEAKAQDPQYQKTKKLEESVKESVKSDLGGLFSQISAVKAEDPNVQKAKKLEKEIKEHVKTDLGSLFSELASLKKQKDVLIEEHPELIEEEVEEITEFAPELVEEVLTEVSPMPTPVGVVPPEVQIPDIDKYLKPTGITKQEEASPFSKEFKTVNDKIKFLEQWIGKIQNTGPGSGEVNFRYLDDVDRSTIVDGNFLTYNAESKKFEFRTVSAVSSFNPTDIRNVYAEVKNADSVTIHKGDPVYLYGATGNKASVIQAKNTSDQYSAKTLGLAFTDIAPGNTGFILTKGVLVGVDTSMYAEGDTLYLGATAGTLTNVKPHAPNHLVYIGVVERANQGQGQIYVSPQNGYELEELHNVNIDDLVELVDGQFLKWSAADSMWVNSDLPDTLTWTNPTPGPTNNFKTVIAAQDGYASINILDGVAPYLNSYSWKFDKTKITFPDNSTQTTAWTGTYSYNDLTNKPTLFSGSYTDLTNKPTIPSLTGYATETFVNTAISNVVGAAPDALNTLKEIADQLASDESAVSSLTTTVAGKVSLTGSYANPAWITSLAYGKLTGAPTAVSSFTNDSGYLTSVNWTQVADKPQNIVTLNDSNVITNDMLVNKSITIGDVTVTLGQVITALTGLTSVTSNGATAFIAGPAAESNVALQMPRESALRNPTNGFSNMYFDVSNGGSAHGAFQFRSSNGYTNVLTMSPTSVTFNTGATVTARTASVARTGFNAPIDTEIIVDELRFRISNQGGIFPQVIGHGSSRNLAWTGIGAISGTAVTQLGSVGTIVASNAWTTLYNGHGLDSSGDTVTVTLQDKAGGRIYRVTFMRSDNGTTTGYNIIAERLL